MSKEYVIIWCNEGLEGIIPVTDIEQKEMWDALQGIPAPGKVRNHIFMAMLRAKFNSQRAYEIYAVTANDDITEESLRDMFTESPQYAADLIRKRGAKLYSDRVNTAKIVIT